MRTSVYISIILLTITLSCNYDSNKSSIETITEIDNKESCLLIEYNEYTDCRVLKINGENVNSEEYWCGDIPPIFVDDFSRFFPKEKVLFVDEIFKPSEETRIVFWDYNFIKEVKILPFKYSYVNIKEFINDTVISILFNNKKLTLLPDMEFLDSVITRKKEENKLVEYKTKFIVKNLGRIQKSHIIDTDTWEHKKKELDLEQYYSFVWPEFYGGVDKLRLYLEQSINYPEELKRKGVKGKVLIKFTVDSIGDIHNARILRGLHPILDKEALKAIENMPRWIPAMNNNIKTTAEMVLPIIFEPE